MRRGNLFWIDDRFRPKTFFDKSLFCGLSFLVLLFWGLRVGPFRLFPEIDTETQPKTATLVKIRGGYSFHGSRRSLFVVPDGMRLGEHGIASRIIGQKLKD